ncbi:lysostaphin resistance A-like protein [Okibacterium fritillariae]|uniref:CPBP family intramembrane glutamic endopeptidase n=1 Tax=Okibacterium fritillariae TaxID=123320 RepID=UPI004055842F
MMTVRSIDHSPRDHAVWRVRHPLVRATGWAFVPVVFTAVASAVGQVGGLGDGPASLVIAAGAALSAVVGLLVVRRSRVSLPLFGFRAPARARDALWFVPALLTVVIALATQGVGAPPSLLGAFAIMSLAVAVNEELWFRGIVLAVLRSIGTRAAIVGSALLFGVLHLANLAAGVDLGAALLQLAFAALFGLVAAQLAVLTGSLWPAIVWHAAWDVVNLSSGNEQGAAASVGLALACLIMLAYAGLLWRPVMRTGVGDGSSGVAPYSGEHGIDRAPDGAR